MVAASAQGENQLREIPGTQSSLLSMLLAISRSMSTKVVARKWDSSVGEMRERELTRRISTKRAIASNEQNCLNLLIKSVGAGTIVT